jgi:hypothetical protein
MLTLSFKVIEFARTEMAYNSKKENLQKLIFD